MLPAKFLRTVLTAIALGALIPTGALAEDAAKEAVAPAPPLKVGDVAPALKPQKWLQGEPVTAFAKDKTYIIECWATWCIPCVGAIPHVNTLHNKFKDRGLVVIGMDVHEDDIAKPSGFLKKTGDGMAYRVAFDGGKAGDTIKSWMGAAGVRGIPHTFVVHEGKLIWHGHPDELKDALVESMISGKYDYVQVEKDRAAKEARQKKVQGLVKSKKFDEALAELASAEKDAVGEEAKIIRYQRAGILVDKGDAGAAKNLVDLANSAPDEIFFQYFAANQLLNSPKLKDQRDPKSAKVFIGRLLADDPSDPTILLLDAQADYALGDKAGAEKTLTALAGSTEKNAARSLPKAKAALEAVKADKEWPAEKKPKSKSK